MSSLLNSVQSYFSEELIKKAASLFGESESTTQKIFNAGIPSILSGLIGGAKTDDGHNLLNMAKKVAGANLFNDNNKENIFNAANSAELHNEFSFLGNNTNWLSLIFGKKTDAFTSLISNFTNAKESSVKSILSSIAPVCLGFIGKQAVSSNSTSSGLFSWLNTQKENILGALPLGFNANEFFSFSQPTASTPKQPITHKVKYEEKKKKSSNLWIWLLLLLLALLCCWFFMRSCGCCKKETEIEPIRISADSLNKTVEVVRESMKVKLKNGVEIDAYKGGIEDVLVKCLDDSSCEPSKSVWYDFDNLNFRIGSDSLTEESMSQVKNIVEMLKAYPDVKIKIGGYADKSGDSTASWNLSQSRANVVLTELEKQGADKGQLTGAEGYGWQFAKYAPEAPEADRRKDRRISLQLNDK